MSSFSFCVSKEAGIENHSVLDFKTQLKTNLQLLTDTCPISALTTALAPIPIPTPTRIPTSGFSSTPTPIQTSSHVLTPIPMSDSVCVTGQTTILTITSNPTPAPTPNPTRTPSPSSTLDSIPSFTQPSAQPVLSPSSTNVESCAVQPDLVFHDSVQDNPSIMRVDSKEATNTVTMSLKKLPETFEVADKLPNFPNTDKAVKLNEGLKQTDEAGESAEDSPTKALKWLAKKYSPQQENFHCEEAGKKFPVHKLSSEPESNDEEDSLATQNTPTEPTTSKDNTFEDSDIPPPPVPFLKEVINTNEEDVPEVVEVNASADSKDSESTEIPVVVGQDLPEYLDMPPPSVMIVNEIRKSTAAEEKENAKETEYLDLPPPSVSIIDEVIGHGVDLLESINMETISDIRLSPLKKTETTLSPDKLAVKGDEINNKELSQLETKELEVPSAMSMGLSPSNTMKVTRSVNSKDSDSIDIPVVVDQDLPAYLDIPPPSVMIVNEIRKSTTEENKLAKETEYLELPPPSVSIVDEVICQEVDQLETIDMETISDIRLSPLGRTTTKLSPEKMPVQVDETNIKELYQPETSSLRVQCTVGLSPPNRTTIMLSAHGVPARVGQLINQVASLPSPAKEQCANHDEVSQVCSYNHYHKKK